MEIDTNYYYCIFVKIRFCWCKLVVNQVHFCLNWFLAFADLVAECSWAHQGLNSSGSNPLFSPGSTEHMQIWNLPVPKWSEHRP